ncbi:MAG: GNAT family N-acetyltransferase [Planctomycetia bacterium]|nr:GNAT family N-acetyltransferase [Planctomycetia bacterium]
MELKTFKRYRMEIDLRQTALEIPPLPQDYYVEPWSRSLLEAHATAHYLSFRDTPDATLFGNFQTFRGCRRVMENIFTRRNFLPAATHLIVYHPAESFHTEFVATIQGVLDAHGQGAIQNIGVVPNHQGKGLGKILLQLSLRGYQEWGVRIANLEVTSDNTRALRLYSQTGFRITQVFYKAATPRQ